MAEGGIGEPTCKPPTSKEELGGVLKGIIRLVSTKTLPTHSTFHLRIYSGEIILWLMITEQNKQKRALSNPAMLFDN